MLLNEIMTQFVEPNFEHAYNDVIKYDDIKHLKREEWLKLAAAGKQVSFKKLKHVGNTSVIDLESAKKHWKTLHDSKRKKFLSLQSPFKMSIVVQSGNELSLLGPDIELAGHIINGVDPKVWLVKL